MPFNINEEILEIKDIIIKKFTRSDWMKLGLITNNLDYINNHRRLLRSLDFGDDDYEGNVIEVLLKILKKDNISNVKDFFTNKFETDGVCISSEGAKEEKIYFTPSVFKIPTNKEISSNFLSVMMPFDRCFDDIYSGIQNAAFQCGMTCQRADDMWESSTIIQDIFALIYKSHIVVCDFTDKNPNVLYEAGIAHTLGKFVIPLAQHHTDIPFDLKSHRYLMYDSNQQGIDLMKSKLIERIKTIKSI